MWLFQDTHQFADLIAFLAVSLYWFSMEQLSTLPGVDIPGFQGSGRNPVQRTGVSLFSLVSIIFYAYIDIPL